MCCIGILQDIKAKFTHVITYSLKVWGREHSSAQHTASKLIEHSNLYLALLPVLCLCATAAAEQHLSLYIIAVDRQEGMTMEGVENEIREFV